MQNISLGVTAKFTYTCIAIFPSHGICRQKLSTSEVNGRSVISSILARGRKEEEHVCVHVTPISTSAPGGMFELHLKSNSHIHVCAL